MTTQDTITSIASDITPEELIGCDLLKSRIENILSDIDPTNAADLSTLTESELQFAISLEIGLMPKELTISCGETRQIKQYSPNVYNSTMTLDISAIYEALLSLVVGSAKGFKLETYLKGRRMLFKTIASRFADYETFQRKLIHDQQKTVDIVPTPANL
jgi:hypothetical protein